MSQIHFYDTTFSSAVKEDGWRIGQTLPFVIDNYI